MTNLLKRDAHASATPAEHRSQTLDFTRATGDDEVERFTFPLSSEQPYRRWRGNEILVHEKGAVDLSFLKSGNAPLLMQHNSYSGQVGVIEDAWLDESRKRVYVTARFSRRPEAQAVKQDVEDGIMRNVSVGYNIDPEGIVVEEHAEGEVPSYRVTKWKPMEASIVSIPADETVGVGRSTQAKEGVMPDPNPQATGGLPPATRSADPATPASQAPVNVMSEAERGAEIAAQMDEINALARSHNMADEAASFIAEAMRKGETPSLAQFRGVLRAKLPADTPLVNNDVGLGDGERRRFSIIRLARAMRNGATSQEEAEASFEIEACEQAARNFEGHTNGWRLPEEVMRGWSDFEVGGVSSQQFRAAMSTTGNPNVQDVDHLAGRFIDNLRNRSSIMRAGVTTLTGLTGNVEIPGGDANSTAGWLGAEGDDAPETNPTFRKVEMAIKDIAGYTDLTRRMLQQTTIDIEMYVRNQLLTAIALGIDLAGLEGSGAAGVPEGVKNTTGIGSVTFAAATPTRDELIDMWAEVADANADQGNLRWIFNSLMAGDLMKTKVDAGSGKFLLDGPDSPLLALQQIRSNQATTGDVYFGNWADLLMGMWGGLDLDRTTEGDVFLSGGLRLRGIQSVDFAVARVGSFVLGNDGV